MIANYNDLVKAILRWAHRKDIAVDIPNFIQLAETEFYSNPVEPLQIKQLEFTSTTLTDGSRLALPDYFQKMRMVRLVLDTDKGLLLFRSPQELIRSSGTGRPKYFTIIGNEIEFDVTPDTDYTVEIEYWRTVPSLSQLR